MQTEQLSTVSEQYDLSRLTGKLVRVWPYARGWYARDFMYLLWRMVEEDKASHLLFHIDPGKIEGQPYETRGDLVAFCEYFKDRLLLVSEHIEKKEICGMVWFDEIMLGKRATASVFCRRKFWGDAAREASVISLDYAFQRLKVNNIWAGTPWKTAVEHAKAMGFKEVAVIDDIESGDGRVLNNNVLKLTREDFYSLHTELI